MKRNVYLEGELGELFVKELTIVAESPSEVFRCLDANFSDFQRYMIEQHEKGVGFEIDVAGESLEYESELLMNISEGDITITPIPAGSKSAGAKILAAIAIVAVVWATGGFGTGWFGTSGGGWALSAAGGLSWQGALVLGLATNLALTGIMQLMAPDPATDNDQEQSYLFNGAEQNIIEGDPVPVLYGKLRVPGQPISFDLAPASSVNGGSTIILPNGEVLDLDFNWSGFRYTPVVPTPTNLNVNP